MTPICIAGMHRSGTSMIARLLHECGLYLGQAERNRQGCADQPFGYWEHGQFVELNEQILDELGGWWGEPPDIPEVAPGWSEKKRFDGFRQQASAIIEAEFRGRLWGWKDPRNCLTLEFWQGLFPQMMLVICLRHPVEVARSLSTGKPARDFTFEAALEMWRGYYATMVPLLGNVKGVVVTHYDTYFRNPEAELRRVVDEIGLTASEKVIRQAIATISEPARHHKVWPGEAAINGEIARYYGMLCEQAGYEVVA